MNPSHFTHARSAFALGFGATNTQGAVMAHRHRTPARSSRRARAVLRARRRDERGVSAVEFALVLPLLVMLLFGVTTAGLAYNDNLSISNAVREGARLGAALDYSANPTAWANSVQQRVQQVYFNAGSSLSLSQICVELDAAPGSTNTMTGLPAVPTTQGSTCGTAPTLPTNMAPNSCAVRVWVQKPAKISLIVFPDYNFNIGAQSVAYYGRSVQNGCQSS